MIEPALLAEVDADAQAHALLQALFRAAVAAADPALVLAGHLPERPSGRCIVVGAGKAAARMAAALEEAWPDVPLQGLVVTRDGHAVPTRRIEVIEAAHPVPDARSALAARRMLDQVARLTADDLVIALLSGGGSATLMLPAPGLSLVDKVAVHRALLASGMPIGEMNAVRGALSAIKGGHLAAAAAPTRVVTLVISDVPGDRPEQIASGPTIGPPPSRALAREIVRRHHLPVPPTVTAFLSRDEPVAADPFTAPDVRLIASPALSLAAARDVAVAHGLTVDLLGDAIEGEARVVGRDMALRVPLPGGLRPRVLLSGGETTVTLDGPAGRGGRNTEFLLSFALALNGRSRCWALAADTDGIDGSEDAAGAFANPSTLARAATAGLDAAACLAAHDSYAFFAGIGDLLVTGPTHTNVNDFRAVLIG